MIKYDHAILYDILYLPVWMKESYSQQYKSLHFNIRNQG